MVTIAHHAKLTGISRRNKIVKAIYKFKSDCGRMGTLYGLFVAESKDVNDLLKSKDEVCFGEVYDTEIKMITDEQDIVKIFQAFNMETGFNPVKMWKEQKEE